MRTERITLQLAAIPALLLLAFSGRTSAADFDLGKGPPATVQFTNKKKVALDDVTLNCLDNPANLTFYWRDSGRVVYDFPGKSGRVKVPAGRVKQLIFKPYGISLPGNKFPNIPVYTVLVKLRSGVQIKAVMQVGNIWGNFSGPAPKFGTIKNMNGKSTWAVEYDYAPPPGNLRLKDITYPPLPDDVDPDAKKK